MSQFYAVFGVVFLGILSLGMSTDMNNFEKFENAATQYALQELGMCHKMRSSMMKKFSSGVQQSFGSSQGEPSGFAPVNTVVDGETITICSGPLLKSWLLLTTANCVHNHSASDLSVDVTYWEWGVVKSSSVEVHRIIFDPSFKKGGYKNDRAILVLYGSVLWFENGFLLPIFYASPKFIVYNKWRILQNRFKFSESTKALSEYETNDIFVTLDYTKCNETTEVLYWYCAEFSRDNYEFNTFDIGSPFFTENSHFKVLHALYTGHNMEEKGHMYESIFPSITWLVETILKHIIPPIK